MTERRRTAGWLVLMGGSGPDGIEPRILRRFLDLAGGAAEARVVVVPTASEQRVATIESYQNAFELEDVQDIEVLDIRTHHQADLPETLRVLHEATGIMFTGGDQLRLLSILNGTGFVQELRRRSRGGLVVGGSSAGAMALGDPVIIRGEPGEFYVAGEIRHMPGLDVADGLSVDTHLLPRGRLVRLLPVVRARPDRLGLGIDEGCGVTISPKGMLTVVGPGVVFVIDGSKAQSSGADVPKPGAALSVTGLQLHVLSDGDEFDLKARQIVRR